MRILQRLALLALVLALGLVAPSAASAAPGDVSVGASGGAVFLGNAQSFAVEHRLKPLARIDGLLEVDPRLSLGVEAAVILGGTSDYRVAGASVLGLAWLHRGDAFGAAVRFGFGAGTGARILATDLRAESDVVPYAQLGLHLSWRPARAVSLDLALLSEQLTLATLSAGVRIHL